MGAFSLIVVINLLNSDEMKVQIVNLCIEQLQTDKSSSSRELPPPIIYWIQQRYLSPNLVCCFSQKPLHVHLKLIPFLLVALKNTCDLRKCIISRFKYIPKISLELAESKMEIDNFRISLLEAFVKNFVNLFSVSTDLETKIIIGSSRNIQFLSQQGEPIAQNSIKIAIQTAESPNQMYSDKRTFFLR